MKPDIQRRKFDVVIPCRTEEENNELRYTIRSLKNLPHGKVIITGFTPSWVKNVISIDTEQVGDEHFSIWVNNVKQACEDERLSDDFYLFNDDFYVLRPVTELKPYYNKTIKDKLKQSGRSGAWASTMYNTLQELVKQGIKDPLHYDLHVPMPMNKQNFLEAYSLLNKHDDKTQQMRSFYGNYFNIGGDQLTDVKVTNGRKYWNEQQLFISSEEKTFGNLPAFDYVRELFSEPCEYER